VVLRGRAWWRRTLGLPLAPHTEWERVPCYPKLFVVGCPRSGTTWLTSMLQRHPSVIGSGESHAYSTVLGPFVDRGLRGDAGWRRVLTRYDLMASRGWGVGLHRYVDRRTLCRFIVMARAHHGRSDEAAAMQVVTWCFDDFFARRRGCAAHLLVEKTPRHQFYASRILRHRPEARLVEMVRDARDVCVSMQGLSDTHFWAPGDRRRQLETWLRYVAAGAAARAQEDLAPRILLVRYEALWADPVGELRRICAFAGLDCPLGLAREIAAATAFSRYARTGPGRPRRRGVVGDWHNHFTATDLALFRELAGPAARALGYTDV
jgi:hypothetical protein